MQNLLAATSALPQVLASQQLPAAEAAIYTCPANSAVKIANASVTNVSGAAVTLGIAVVKNGGTIGDGTHKIVPATYSLPAGDTLPLKDLLGGHVLGPGDVIAAVCSSATAADFVMSGTVFS